MSDIHVTKKNDVYCEIHTSQSIATELSETFTFDVEGSQWSPAYKQKRWDGKIRLFSTKTNQLYYGLLPHMCIFAAERKYSVKFDKNVDLPTKKPDADSINKFFVDRLNVHANGKKIEPREFQIEAFRHAVSAKRSTILSATSSGKSLVIYALVRYYLETTPKDKKILIIVPTIGLVNQMFNDFDDYSSHSKWNAQDNCHKIFGGESKSTDMRVVISTYQSLYDLPKSYFAQFGSVIGDEAHIFKAKTLKKIMHSLEDCPNRTAFTGTLQDVECHKLVIEGVFGMAKSVVTAREMISAGYAPDIEINCLALTYGDAVAKEVSVMTYQEERKFLCSLPQRNKFVVDLVNRLKGNTLVLFELVEDHGKILHEMMKKETTKNVYFVYGKTDADERESIRQIMESESDAIIIASYGVFSTGISIKKLHNLVFAGSPGKKQIRIVQSMGRILREHVSKSSVNVYDIADDCTYKGKENFLLKHFVERANVYIKEDHPYKIIPIRV